MDFGSIKDKAAGMLGNEEQTDAVLDKVEGVASKVTGGKFDDKIESARDAIDQRIGDEAK
ncbi:MAG: antitoxin [Actinomycetaceae bacterium]|nr:antitoxin [Actinomycetaceae bacterium]